MITFEEFQRRAHKEFRELNKNAPDDDIQTFLKENDKRIQESYESTKQNYNGAENIEPAG